MAMTRRMHDTELLRCFLLAAMHTVQDEVSHFHITLFKSASAKSRHSL